MKMSDVFELPVRPAYTVECDKDGDNWEEYYFAKQDSIVGAFKYPNTIKDIYSAASYAINNHDRMADEIAELRELIRKNSQVFKFLSGDDNETIGAVTEKLQAFDAHLVNEALLDKYK